MKKKIVAVTGLSGVIGRILSASLAKKVTIVDLFHSAPVALDNPKMRHAYIDLLNPQQIQSTLATIAPDCVIHLAAITHIDICEMDKGNGKKGIVWKTNVEGTDVIAQFCAKHATSLVYLSTECVFDGKQKFYDEDAPKHPINWYGVTKSEAENKIIQSRCPSAIVRAVVAYHQNDQGKTIFGKLYSQLKYSKKVKVVSDQYFTPTYTYDIVDALVRIVDQDAHGIFHVAPSDRITPYQFAVLVAKKFRLDPEQIQKTTLRALYGPKNAVLRLRNACLRSVVTNKHLNINPRSPEQVFQKIASNRIDLHR